MANLKNHELELEENSKNKKVMNLNRSMTTVKTTSEMTNKPLFNLSSTLHRNGSIKTLSTFSSFFQASNSFTGKVKKLCSIFESPKYPSPITISLEQPENLLIKSAPESYIPQSLPDSPFRLPGTEDRVVVYYTSLRGIRRTFQDCHSIRMIFRGFRVNLDERDISMDIGYRKELQKVLGEENVSLPQVFIKGKYIGGSDVVKGLLEAGELGRVMKGLPLRSAMSCEGCDDARFFMCTNCDGSRKVYDEVEGRVKRCLECNENGLVRCPICCS